MSDSDEEWDAIENQIGALISKIKKKSSNKRKRAYDHAIGTLHSAVEQAETYLREMKEKELGSEKDKLRQLPIEYKKCKTEIDRLTRVYDKSVNIQMQRMRKIYDEHKQLLNKLKTKSSNVAKTRKVKETELHELCKTLEREHTNQLQKIKSHEEKIIFALEP